MAESYDLVIRGGVVVNQDGEGLRDVGVRAGRIAAIGSLAGASAGALLVEDDDGVRNILRSIRRRSAYHSEDEYRLRERKDARIDNDPRSHPVWRDEITALQCTQRLVGLARETGRRIHVLHITTAQEMAFL